MEYREKKNYEMQLKIANKLYDFTILNNYVDSIRIYFCKHGKILAVESGFWNIEDFEDREIINMISSGNIKYGWIPVRKIFSEERNISKDVITVIKPIPLISIQPEVVIIINIKEHYIKNLVQSVCSATLGSVYIVNNDGDVLSQVNNSQPYIFHEVQGYFKNMLKDKQGQYRDVIDGEKYLISHVQSDMHEWKYINIYPYSVITSKIAFIQKYFVVIFSINMLIGLLISLILAGKINKPILSIANLLNRNNDIFDEGDIYSSIEKNIYWLIETND